MYKNLSVDTFIAELKKQNPGEIEFHQAVFEVAQSILPFIIDNPKYTKANILQRLVEPDRTIIFRVTWVDDEGNIQVNRGYRVQFNNSIGPYKGGIRFHPSVNLSILKFLGFEQTFKNSLTTLPLGSGKGGSDFNPKGKSDNEIMSFCQAFMTELYQHISPNTDVAAGDIGVGAREIAYLFGQYKRLSHEFSGILTGKGIEFGGSLIRTEATGYGVVYFMEEMLKHQNNSIQDKNCAISGSGNVAIYCAEKIIQLGGRVITLSDSSGFIHDKNGIDEEKLAYVIDLKTVRRGRISQYAERYKCDFHAWQSPWSIPCDLAFPCATQNELNKNDAQELIANGCIAITEGANMPTTPDAIKTIQDAKLLFGPGKAANAGGVAVSGLEMAQNSSRISWTEEELEKKLHEIIKNIHKQCITHGDENGYVNYIKGANISGFIKVADAMLAQGAI